MLKFILIAHRDGGEPARVFVCDTELEREKATATEIYGSPENVSAEAFAKELHDLRTDGWLRFEGDPPLQWVTADCVDGDGTPLL